jgi:DedD protein
MSEGQDTEITLGTGRLLGLFFGLIIVCALFFGLGFSMGRNSVKSTLTMEQSPVAPNPAAPNAEQKASPAMAQKSATDGAAATSEDDTAQSRTPTVSSPSASSSSTVPAPELSAPSQLSSGGAAYTVQVAAVSKQEDADALVSALRKRAYPVFIASNGSDKLFHVQIGPFNDIKDAEAMKTKLTGDGYNPIVKR